MLIFAETPAGYAVFKAKDKLLKKRKDGNENVIFEHFAEPEKAASTFKLEAFEKFKNTTEALENVAALIEGKVSEKLLSFLTNLEEKSGPFIVQDAKLGNAINKITGLDFQVISDAMSQDFFRGIRENLSVLIKDLAPKNLDAMSLGLSHSFSRHKLRFSPDKIDTMIVQAIALLDDLDKELNIYIMRCKEWYGWHFPEMTKILQDNLAYVKAIKAMGMRTNASSTDFSAILPEDLEAAVKSAAEMSMGSEITEEDLENILYLADQILALSDYRVQLAEYLRNRMQAIAPNLTILVGEIVGARLIAHAGSLLNLAKHPASTIQILGAEKALFRALKTKHDTPKYGLIYHASLVGQAPNKVKGKIARLVATKASLGLRYDALNDDEGAEDPGKIGLESRLKIEARLRALGEGNITASFPVQQPKKYELLAGAGYNPAADVSHRVLENEIQPSDKLAESSLNTESSDPNKDSEKKSKAERKAEKELKKKRKMEKMEKMENDDSVEKKRKKEKKVEKEKSRKKERKTEN